MENIDPMDVPGAKVTLPISTAKKPFDRKFIADAKKYWSNMHMQVGGDHAMYYTGHLSEFLPTAVAPASGKVSVLERNLLKSVGETTFVRGDGSTSLPLDEYVNNGKQRLQGIMILQHGKVVYEAYPGMQPEQPHFWASTSKPTVGTLITMLEADGLIDVNKPITTYAKQLAGTEWDKVSLLNGLNMSSALDIAETGEAQMNPASVFQRFLAADFGVPNYNGVIENTVDVLRDAKPLPGEVPGEYARYSSLITKVLVWVIEEATGHSFIDNFNERIWSKIGVRNSFIVPMGSDGSAGAYGLNISLLEDLARFSLIFTPSWKVVSESQVISPQVLKTMQTSGSKEAYLKGDFTEHNWVKASFAKQGMPDRNSRQWDAVWDDGAMFKHGNLFQGLYVDPSRDVTAAYFSTCPVNLDPDILMGYIRQVAMNLQGE
ncbi:CubicO group peptidase (beta-lactamase class C family) [Algoriphagus boseongensis]|uniref:CubicO group peptidase (Beta-lactamase class C family) n=1 Tax=Algoriphagus boseongensis TaxID=1442587 RepID=A0A4R6T8G4_9BACT|nr:serine hydrolase domain-containing protein [Algoriphagus boseongensis]TDQ19300.1 CubicO group peptidase (beta-lactamase class C family) [Algoriphagus boseongensis]